MLSCIIRDFSEHLAQESIHFVACEQLSSEVGQEGDIHSWTAWISLGGPSSIFLYHIRLAL